jgi:SCP-2 sterol transfer family
MTHQPSSSSRLEYELMTPERLEAIRKMDRTSVRNAILGVPKADLAAWLATADGEAALDRAFARMPEYYVSGLLNRQRLVRWNVERDTATALTFDLELDSDRCVVQPVSNAANPDLTLTVSAVGFVEMASKTRRATEMFMQGQLKVQGNVRLAMKMESLFDLDSEEQDS